MKIDCNDNGALYVEARVNIPLSDFLQNTDDNDIHVFLAAKPASTEESNGFFSLFQVSFFACGGFAIGLCISHVLADGASINTFMKTWAASMTGDFSDKLTFPVYEAANLFPATKIPSDVRATPTFPEQRFPSKRLVFNSSTIASLKTKFRHVAPSKTELVTAIIWKSALNAARSNSRSSKQSPMTRAVNIRRRITPPLSSNSVGNSVGFDTVVKDESEVDVAGLISEMRKGLTVFDEKVVKTLKTEKGAEALIDNLNELMSVRMRDDVDAYFCSSLCNFGWYDVDMGWGRPVWVTVPISNMKNGISLIDRRDGSVEARVVLDEKDMYLFQRDPQLLAFASCNPTLLE